MKTSVLKSGKASMPYKQIQQPPRKGLKGAWHEIFYFSYIHESVSFVSLSIQLGSF